MTQLIFTLTPSRSPDTAFFSFPCGQCFESPFGCQGPFLGKALESISILQPGQEMGISVYNLLILEGLGFKSLLWPWADRRSENQLLLHLENGAVVPLCGVFVRIKRNDPEESSRSRHSCLLWSRSRGGPAGSHQNCSVSCSGVRPHSDILWGKIAAILLARVNRHGAWGLCAVSHGRKV